MNLLMIFSQFLVLSVKKKGKKIEKHISFKDLIEKMLGLGKMLLLGRPLKDIVLSEKSKPQKVTCSLIPFM